ncbi:MAG: serine/threonine protein kinase [Oscillochloris sp.]|nr:serine/threonine protein kinase [Oscillochloris sp.]
MHVAPDTLLQGRYRVERLIAQGGMGAVYRARDERLGNTVALKQTLVTDPYLRAAFEREARLLAGLHHPALPMVSDHFAEGSDQFLVMQFIPGDDLATLLQQRGSPFTLGEVLPWVDRLLDALDYLHTQTPPIIHRDIKPLNLKLTKRGEIILLDFGLAKGSVGQPDAGQSTATAARSIFGYTPQYAPLEQIKGSGTDPRSDLYSAAATFYELLTGNPPPDALTRVAALVVNQPDPLIPAQVLRPGLPPALGGLLFQAMAMHPDQRPASAAVMRAALQAALQPQAPPVVAPTVAAGSVGPNQPTIAIAGSSAGQSTIALPKADVIGAIGNQPSNGIASAAQASSKLRYGLIFGIAALLVLVLAGAGMAFLLIDRSPAAISNPERPIDQSPEAMIGTREQPVPPGGTAGIPGWEVRVVEQIRGENAFRLMRDANRFNDRPPDGFEYLLLKLEVRTTFSDREERQLYPEVVGARRIEYSRQGVAPEPIFPQDKVAGDQQFAGYIPFIVGVDERDILVKIGELGMLNAAEPVFLALEVGSALPDDPALAAIEPNRVGADPREPASLNELAILEDWEFMVREVVRGEEALERLLAEYDDVEQPAAGREYALAYVEVHYIGDGGFGEATEHADRNLFKSGTIIDGDVTVVDAPPVYILPQPELDHWLYPGGAPRVGW